MLVKYWTAFYYPISDDLTVIDGAFTWALLFYHEEEVFFGSNVTLTESEAAPNPVGREANWIS